MQVCSNFKRFRASLQELLGIKRRKQVKGDDISAPYNFKKETTVIPGVTQEELEVLRDKAAASHLDPLRQHSNPPSASRSRRGVDRNRNTTKSKSHNQLRGSASLANLALPTPSSSTTPPSTSNNKRQLGTSKSCLSLNNLPSSSFSPGQGQQPPRKFSVPNSASSPTVSSHQLLGIGGGEMGTGLRPPSPCLSLPIRIGITSVAGVTGAGSSPVSPTTTSPSSPLGVEMGVRAQRSRASINGSGNGSYGSGSGSGSTSGSGTTTPKSPSSVLIIGTEGISLTPINTALSHSTKERTTGRGLELNTSPSTTTTTSTSTAVTGTYVSAPASAAASEVSAVSAVSATADLDLFVLGSPISPISPTSPVSLLSLDDDVQPKRVASV
ncbi:hypothetical protein QBC32DRAFT_57899 [Pseudoneurospora amorphoporcata]|uniref:Uncharacterized protein n=1 Tax=Pseudoneurospora amorphoporcata TaxID=241081 RepID=A0AAN6SIQ7_9PEZI|nr:hypothetical protein QBC32DRAFT_57899 [Pseudoneurospora amorphoporcata]